MENKLLSVAALRQPGAAPRDHFIACGAWGGGSTLEEGGEWPGGVEEALNIKAFPKTRTCHA